MIDYIYDVHRHFITQWNQDLPNHGALQHYADAISGQGAPLTIALVSSMGLPDLVNIGELFIIVMVGSMP